MRIDLFKAFEEAVNTKEFPFAVYSKPGDNAVKGIFQRMQEIYPLNFEKEGFAFAPFAGGEAAFIPIEASEVLSIQFVRDNTALQHSLKPEINTQDKEAFKALVTKSITAIKNDEFKKLVCSRTERLEVNSLDVVATYKKMVSTYPSAFCYCFYHPETGLWMGATPEQLLKAEGDVIQTVALAGTQIFKDGDEPVWAEKERQEQSFVTDYIIDELKLFVDDVEASSPYTFRAGNIIHIKTDIAAKLKAGSELKDVITALHPTPAVCGLPKAEAMEFLLDNEGYNREYYSGYLGEIKIDGNTDLFVNLRCMKIYNTIVQLYIGCGITKDSDPESEFIETVNKSLTMKKVLI